MSTATTAHAILTSNLSGHDALAALSAMVADRSAAIEVFPTEDARETARQVLISADLDFGAKRHLLASLIVTSARGDQVVPTNISGTEDALISLDTHMFQRGIDPRTVDVAAVIAHARNSVRRHGDAFLDHEDGIAALRTTGEVWDRIMARHPRTA